MISYSDLIHYFFYSALTEAEIDQLVGHLFDKDPPILWPDTVPMPYCTENPPPVMRTIAFSIFHLIYD
jgi:hypothetical protein